MCGRIDGQSSAGARKLQFGLHRCHCEFGTTVSMTLHVETWYDAAAEDATPCHGDITSPRGTAASPRGSSLRGGTWHKSADFD